MNPAPDRNYHSISDTGHLTVQGRIFCPEFEGLRAEDFDDILKLSHVHNVTVRNCDVLPRGIQREDAIDIMRESRNVYIEGGRIAAGKKYAVTVKGGSDAVLLRDIEIVRPGGGWEKVDIDIGNDSHVSPKKTGTVTITNVFRTDGKPVRIRVGWAKKPRIFGPSKYKVLFWQSLGLKLYVAAMRVLRAVAGKGAK